MKSYPAFCATAPCAPRMPATRLWPDKSLKQLEALATGSRNRVIQSSYNGAAGTLL